jgi:hypothetical protein
VDCSFVCCDNGMCTSPVTDVSSCVASVVLQEIGVVHLCHIKLSCLLYVTRQAVEKLWRNGKIVCVRYEAMWRRGLTPRILNLGSGGEGVSGQFYASAAVHPARGPEVIVGSTTHVGKQKAVRGVSYTARS